MAHATAAPQAYWGSPSLYWGSPSLLLRLFKPNWGSSMLHFFQQPYVSAATKIQTQIEWSKTLPSIRDRWAKTADHTNLPFYMNSSKPMHVLVKLKLVQLNGRPVYLYILNVYIDDFSENPSVAWELCEICFGGQNFNFWDLRTHVWQR